MPKSVKMTNLNPESDYPICRFQVVEYTDEANPGLGKTVPTSDKQQQTGEQSTITDSSQTGRAASRAIAQMHQRATELLNQLIERRQKSTSRTFHSHTSARSEPAEPPYTAQTKMYLDSGGSVHGPMDQKHTTRLGNISRSGQVIPGSKYYLSDGSSQSRTMRRQSESGAWDMKSEMRSYQTTDSFRGRTYSESRRPFESSSQRPYYRTTASHTVSATSPPSHHISRWSSMQSTGTQGLWRGGSSSASRYATTLTRQHIKRHREPVEMLVKHPPSLGASKVDLVSIDNRRSSSPQLHYVTTVEREMSSDREKRLQDELINTRRELQELKRSHSLTGDQHLLSSSKYNVKSTSTQYLNDGTWTTHTLKKNEGMPCGARVSTRPYRAVSQTNISGRQPMARNQWISDIPAEPIESNLRTTTTYKQPPMYSTYSAHRENMRKMEELRRNNEDWTSNRQLEESKSAAGTEVLEEMETITLQPIGRGVHDLEPTGSIARSYRANTPTASLAFTPGPDQSDGYRTIATTNLHREVHTSGAPSPYAGTHHNTFYEGTNRGMDSRYRVVTNQSETQWRGTDSLNAAYPGSFAHAGSISGVSGHGDLADSEQGLLRQVKETFMDWYLPEKTREEVNALLRDKEPGSFIIRNSISYVNSFSIGLKIPQNSPHVPTRPDDIKSGFVRHFIIGTVPMNDGRGDGLQLCGFVNQPVFPSLVAFVHHHILQPGPFPCPLRLPGSIGQGNIVPVQQARMNYAPTGSQISGVAGSTGLASASAGAAGAGGDGIAADMLYLGQVEVDRLESAAAARRAVTQILTQASQGVAALPKRCEVFIKAIPHDGITFVDKTKRTMLRKHVKPSQLLWCGIDPENRTFTDPELRARGLPSARLFCIVARRQHFFMHENVVYVFSELEPSQSAINLCHYINGVFHSH